MNRKVEWLKQFLIPLIVLSFTAALFAQYEVSVTSIPVWVKVTDRSGNPVTGLAESDFQVYEDGKKVTTNCFEEVNLDELPQATAPASPQEPVEAQKFVIFLDLYNTTPREYASVKPALQDFLQSLAKKKVEVMLAAFMPDKRLGIISRFTSDLKRIKILLDFAKANPKRDVLTKSKTAAMQDVLSGPESGGLEKTAAARQDNAATDGYQTARILASQEIESSRYTLSALETFAEHLSRIDLKNHASVILVSGGFSVDPGRRYFNMATAFTDKAGDQNAQSNPQLRRTGFSFRDEMQEAIGKLNRLNVTLYTLDTRGVATEQEFQDSLIQMAQETGGLPSYNTDNFAAGLERVQDDIKHQYLVCYSPPQHKSLGKYHRIRVELQRGDTTLRYRDGYWE